MNTSVKSYPNRVEDIYLSIFPDSFRILVSVATNKIGQLAKNYMADRKLFKEHFYKTVGLWSKYLQ